MTIIKHISVKNWRRYLLAITGIALLISIVGLPSPAKAIDLGSWAPNTYSGINSTFYAYLETGEDIQASYTLLGGPLEVRNGGTLTVEGPGSLSSSCTIPAISSGGASCSTTSLVATESGIFSISYTLVNPGNDSSMYGWGIDVNNGGVEQTGRVWSESYNMSQTGAAAGDADFTVYYTTPDGLIYEATFFEYNGIHSLIASSPVGVAWSGTCNSAYRSRVQTTQRGETPDPDTYTAVFCGDFNKLFYEEPDTTTLPAEATRWDGETDWILADFIEPMVGDIDFVHDNSSIHSGTISYTAGPGFTGAATIYIDTNNDGAYDTELQDFVENGVGSFEWDGLDSNSNPVKAIQDISIRVEITQAGEVHFINNDVEKRGGLEVVAYNGPNAGDATLYWDDTTLDDPTNTIGGICSDTPIRDGTAGVDSTGGVHGWPGGFCPGEGGGITGGWGDARLIDDWVYLPLQDSMNEIYLQKPVIAQDDDYTDTPIDSNTGGTVGSVFNNDTVDQWTYDEVAGDMNVNMLDDDGSGATIDEDGNIVVPAGTAPGTYFITYEICKDTENPDPECDTAIATILVEGTEIAGNEDEDRLAETGASKALFIMGAIVLIIGSLSALSRGRAVQR